MRSIWPGSGRGVAEIRVRRARPGEAITTLDGVARKLEPEMLVIADRDRAQAIAGVMGGAGSEVSAGTRQIVFESAYFKPASIRRTSKRAQPEDRSVLAV